jgi:hypothetical protein
LCAQDSRRFPEDGKEAAGVDTPASY